MIKIGDKLLPETNSFSLDIILSKQPTSETHMSKRLPEAT